MPGAKIKQSLIQKRTQRIEGINNDLAASVARAEKKLYQSITAKFVAGLQADAKGRIINNGYNKRWVLRLSSVYDDFILKQGTGMIANILDGVEEMQSLNREYYTGMASPKTIAATARKMRSDIYELMGVNENGKIIKDGYLNTLMSDKTMLAKIQNQARRAILSQTEVVKYVVNVEKFVTGDGDRMGIMRDFYKDTAMDIVAQSDRMTSVGYADELGLSFAIYEGSVIQTTRAFCSGKAGKVFHRSEIAKFNPETARPPNYNPFLDLGGYNCRHHLNWISAELAVQIRPSAKKFV